MVVGGSLITMENATLCNMSIDMKELVWSDETTYLAGELLIDRPETALAHWRTLPSTRERFLTSR
jgi:hypothetical protein